MPGPFQCPMGGIGLQVGFQGLGDGSCLFLVTGEKRTDDYVPYFRELVRLAPQAMISNDEVIGGDCRAFVQKGRSLQQPDDVLPAAVADVDVPPKFTLRNLYVSQPVANLREAFQDRQGNVYRLDLPLPVRIFRGSDRQIRTYRLCFCIALVQQHLVEGLFIPDAVADDPNQETVPRCFQSFATRRKFIAGSRQQFEWQLQFLVSVAEYLLVDDRQQRVLYGRPGLPYLVQEHDVGRGQIPLHDAFVLVLLFQTADADRPEYLIGGREARHEILERASVCKCQLEPAGNHGFAHSRRPEQQNAFTGQRSQ